MVSHSDSLARSAHIIVALRPPFRPLRSVQILGNGDRKLWENMTSKKNDSNTGRLEDAKKKQSPNGKRDNKSGRHLNIGDSDQLQYCAF